MGKDRDTNGYVNASTEPPPANSAVNRRLLVFGGAVGGVLASHQSFAQTSANVPPNVPQWMKEQGAPILSPAYGVPSEFEKAVIRRKRDPRPTDTAAPSWSPLQNLYGIITPNGLCYERHHNGVPLINPDEHRLIIHGLVDRELIFTMDDLMRFPSVSRIYFMECAGNTQNWQNTNPDWTVQHTHGLVLCCEWTGVLLSTLLEEVGLKPNGKWVLAEGADAAAMTRSLPIEKALDDTIIVYAQNGERLRPEQGYPLRMFVPGYEGNMSIKWLRRLKIGDQPFHTREETSKYTDLMPDGRARQFTFVMEAKSVITRPSGGQQLSGGKGSYEITGLAWSGHGRIKRVDVSVDGGKNWHEARLQEPVLPKALTRFCAPWRWDGGPAILQSRAIDETGYVQPQHDAIVNARGLYSSDHYNAIQSWRVSSDGRVVFHVA
ncbi:sulfite dehydrogenase [Bradyrhizobium sp.]|uniref:sulfite dehydrogenase n=1 Tax=Bradyrhizobium sp. TaxID=376 RepID=UPI002D5C7187|nr:sulfite dehydrogenase [Bradyrhizobium sp.]HZR73476.1 sulfite dehydrogenase [Bradyrhizobium sp.]